MQLFLFDFFQDQGSRLPKELLCLNTLCMSKLDANLNHQWSYAVENVIDVDHAFGVQVDNAGNIYYSLRENTGGQFQAYVYKFTPSGNLIWAKKILMLTIIIK